MPRIAFIVLFASVTALTLLGCKRDSRGNLVGTVLRLVCDIPDDVGSVGRSYPGRIDWPGGSEYFLFRLSKATFEVRLEHTVTTEEPVRIFFIVDEDPDFPTRFTQGEWFYRRRLRRDVGASFPNTFSVPLSRFRDADAFARMVRP